MTPTKDFKAPSKKSILLGIGAIAFVLWATYLLTNLQPIVVQRGTDYQANIYFVFQSNGNVSACDPGHGSIPDEIKCKKLGEFK